MCAKVRIATKGKMAKDFEKFMNSPGLDRKLEVAMVNLRYAERSKKPLGPKSTALIKKIL